MGWLSMPSVVWCVFSLLLGSKHIMAWIAEIFSRQVFLSDRCSHYTSVLPVSVLSQGYRHSLEVFLGPGSAFEIVSSLRRVIVGLDRKE